MAKKKAARKSARKKGGSAPVLARIQGTVKQVRREAEAVLGRARKEAVRLSRDQQRALDGVVKRAQRLRVDFEKLVKQTSKDLEARPKEFLAMLEKQAEKRIEPIVKRLVAPSRNVVNSLAKRVEDLEAQLKAHGHSTPAATPAPAAPPTDVVAPSAGD